VNYLLDTNVCIALLNNNPDSVRKVTSPVIEARDSQVSRNLGGLFLHQPRR
jgi:predicted nucleic acid-binding protein